MTFGEYIQASRNKKELSTEDAANMIGISELQLINLEANKNKPNPKTFCKLVKGLDLDEEFAFDLTQ